jgi:hypothetical protein
VAKQGSSPAILVPKHRRASVMHPAIDPLAGEKHRFHGRLRAGSRHLCTSQARCDTRGVSSPSCFSPTDTTATAARVVRCALLAGTQVRALSRYLSRKQG